MDFPPLFDLIECKHCKKRIDRKVKFCPYCGQEKIDQIDWKRLSNNVIQALSFDKGFFYNFKVLLLEGGAAVNRYLTGQTRSFQNPIVFFLTVLGSFFLVISLTGTLISGEFIVEVDGVLQKIKRTVNSPDQKVVRWIYLMLIILITPLVALITYLFTNKTKQNYLHALITSIFLVSELVIFASIFFLLNRVAFKIFYPIWGYYETDLISNIMIACFSIPFAIFFLWKYYSPQKRAFLRAASVVAIIILAFLSTIFIGTWL